MSYRSARGDAPASMPRSSAGSWQPYRRSSSRSPTSPRSFRASRRRRGPCCPTAGPRRPTGRTGGRPGTMASQSLRTTSSSRTRRTSIPPCPGRESRSTGGSPRCGRSTIRRSFDQTLFIAWKDSYLWAGSFFSSYFPALPRHLLEELYLTDTAAFVNGPHWNREFVGKGTLQAGPLGAGRRDGVPRP